MCFSPQIHFLKGKNYDLMCLDFISLWGNSQTQIFSKNKHFECVAFDGSWNKESSKGKKESECALNCDKTNVELMMRFCLKWNILFLNYDVSTFLFESTTKKFQNLKTSFWKNNFDKKISTQFSNLGNGSNPFNGMSNI